MMKIGQKLRTVFTASSPRRKRMATAIAFLALAAATSASLFATGPVAAPQLRSEKAWPVSTVMITPQNLNPSFGAYGRVESSKMAHLRTDLNAQVRDVHVREGEWVPAGQVLVTLDDREIALQVDEAQADLEQLQAALRSIQIEQELLSQTTEHYASMVALARQKLERHRNLVTQRLISQALLDEVTSQANAAEIQYQSHNRQLADFPNRIAASQAAVDRAQAVLQLAQLDLEKTRIRAPFNGPVLKVHVAPGDRSGLSTVLVDMADASAFEVRVQIPDVYGERFFAHLSRQSPIHARTPDGLTLPLSRFSSQVRQGQSGIDAFFALTVESGAPVTALGRMIELTITLPEESDVVALPIQSIYENDRVYAVRDHRLEAIRVERVGELQTDQGEYRILVRSPALEAGQKIITTQLPRAISGLLVEPA
jgi:HlyD family secretion protein